MGKSGSGGSRVTWRNGAVSHNGSANTIYSLGYDFHANNGDNGNVYQIVNNKDANRTQNFTYDALNRIHTAYTSGPNWGEAFTIDTWGNLTNRDAVAGKTMYEPLNAGPALASNQLPGFGYDPSGNMTQNGGAQYTYDAESRLTSAGGVNYFYDGDGSRVEKSSSTLYWGSGPLAESDLNGSNWTDYIFFNGKRVARIDPNGSLHYYLSDHLGSTSVVTDASGNIQSESDYYPYGGEMPITSGDTNHYKFTGKPRDAESTLDDFGGRYYASSTGRFLSIDPTLHSEILELPQTWNRYSYVYNRPLFATDPDGKCPPCVGAIVGGLVEGGWNLGSQLVHNGGEIQNVNWREVGSNALGGAVAGAIAGATGGGSLIAEAAWGAASNAAGGVVTRVAEGEDAKDAFDRGEVVSDAVSGFVGGAVGHLASDFIHEPEEEMGPRPKGRRKAARYDSELKRRNRLALRALAVSTAAAAPPAHFAPWGWGVVRKWIDAPQEHVTHKICYDYDNYCVTQ